MIVMIGWDLETGKWEFLAEYSCESAAEYSVEAWSTDEETGQPRRWRKLWWGLWQNALEMVQLPPDEQRGMVEL